MDGIEEKKKLALVIGNLPTIEEIDQFRLLKDHYEITCVSTESICGYLSETSRFDKLRCLALPDHEENPTYIPGLEAVLSGFDVVVVKERLGLFSYQVVKAKWKNRFRLAVWIDNLTILPAEDVDQMRTIRDEVTNAADAFLVQTEAVRDALLIEGIENERIFKFAPWVEKICKRDKKVRAGSLNAMKLPESSLLIAHIGQIEWEEGLTDLAAGIKIAIGKDPALRDKLKVVFCGIGSFATQLKQTLIALGVDQQAFFIAPSREAFITILNAADALYVSSGPSRDRIDGSPYRVLQGMANDIPVIANRTPVVEETCGKHRLDFCLSSPGSVADSILKLSSAKSLRNDIVKKNASVVTKQFSESKAQASMLEVFESIMHRNPSIDSSSLDHQVLDVESLVSSKQYLKAIDLIESIFKVSDIPVHHNSNLYRLIGDCFAKLSDNDSAKDAYSKSLEIDPYAAKAHIGLGTVSLLKHNNDVAVLHFQKAVSIAPQDEMAHLGLGLSFQGMGELDEAQNWITKSLEIDPENSAALYSLVKIAYALKSFEAATEAVSTYLASHPHDYNMLFTLGGLQYQLGQYQKVKDSMREIIKIDPMDGKAHALIKQADQAMEQAESLNG